MNKAILYTRFSPRRNSDTCESIETQLEFCRRFCTHNSYGIIAEFQDRSVSGADEDRPVLWDAIESLKRGYALIVYKFDRLARNAFLAYTIERECQKRSAKIISASGEGTIEQSMSPEERLKIGMLRLFAEYERNIIAARTKTAMLRHQANGRRMSKEPPFGFAVDPTDTASLIENEAEQQTIERIVSMKESDMSLRAICRQLQSDGIKCRSKNNWHHTTVKKIIERIDSCKLAV